MTERFDSSFREWAARRPGTPAGSVARKIVGALPPQRRGPFSRSTWLLAAAAPTVALVIAAIVWWPARQPQVDRPPGEPARVAAPPATPRTELPTVLVMPLDKKTTLYLMLD